MTGGPKRGKRHSANAMQKISFSFDLVSTWCGRLVALGTPREDYSTFVVEEHTGLNRILSDVRDC